MSRVSMAFGSFFRLLFGGSLHPNALKYLPEGALPSETEAIPPTEVEATKEPKKSVPKAKKTSNAEHHRDGSLALLALMQREGRLVDFLQEDIEDYDDSEIGASVRDIHRGCRKVLRDHMQLTPVMPGEEDDKVEVKEGFDPAETKLVGKVSGAPPFKGVLRHHGWRAAEVNFPKLSATMDRTLLAPAQVEVE